MLPLTQNCGHRERHLLAQFGRAAAQGVDGCQATGSLRRVAVRAQCAASGCKTACGPESYARGAGHQVAEFSSTIRLFHVFSLIPANFFPYLEELLQNRKHPKWPLVAVELGHIGSDSTAPVSPKIMNYLVKMNYLVNPVPPRIRLILIKLEYMIMFHF